MSDDCCHPPERTRPHVRRLWWALPAAGLLALLPKCPVCILAWLAALFGLGLGR